MRRFSRLFYLLVIAGCLYFPITSHGYVAYESHVFFSQALTHDVMKLLPRAMGNYIFQNRYDYFRGFTYMARDRRNSIYKNKDLEEIRREAYERLMRDIPFCVEALKGGELKLDTNGNNVAGRLGMIAYSIALLKMPEFPDLEYLEKFVRSFEESIVNNLVDIRVFYDGYGDFVCLGDLMERFKPEEMPAFVHQRNPLYAAEMKEDIFAPFRPPDKFNRLIVLTNVDYNRFYTNMINDILDAFVYIWKCSGMDLAHPSYGAPPGTMVIRHLRGRVGNSAGVLAKPSLEPIAFRPPPPRPLYRGQGGQGQYQGEQPPPPNMNQ